MNARPDANDARWLRTIADMSADADPMGNQKLWPETRANLRDIATAIESVHPSAVAAAPPDLPYFAPLEGGDTLIEWRCGSLTLQVELLPDGNIEWNVNDRDEKDPVLEGTYDRVAMNEKFAHPVGAAVEVTDAMVEAACEALTRFGDSEVPRHWAVVGDDPNGAMRAAIRAALSAKASPAADLHRRIGERFNALSAEVASNDGVTSAVASRVRRELHALLREDPTPAATPATQGDTK